ncbi:hydroxysteroid 11-beta-dehydrogenase 1-like protein isoform X3 [Columba livia]
MQDAWSKENTLYPCRYVFPFRAREGGAVCCAKAGGTGLPGAQPHRCEPVPDVGWRCGIHSPAHAGETAQRETRGCSLALGKKSVNFFSYVALATAALQTLERSNGSLVVVSSLTGRIPTPFTTSYSASKFALDGFFTSLRHELTMQKKNVSVTLCILGLIDTATALENTRGKVYMTASPAPEAALAIIRGGAMRVQELFYPWLLQHVCQLWVLFPSNRDQVLQSYYNYSSP